MAATTKVHVRKYNPSIDSGPYLETYDVPWREMMTVLEALKYISEEIEPVAFDYCCRSAGCGTCAMKIDGVPRLACITIVPEGEITIEPLDTFPVIRDLIVDKSEIENRLKGTKPWFSRAEPMTEPTPMPAENYVKVSNLQNCKDCLMCQSVCPRLDKTSDQYLGFDKYAGPYILIQIAKRYFDTRDDLSDFRLKTAVNEGLFNCLQCGTCYSVCPRGAAIELEEYPNAALNHVEIFKEMMDDAIMKGYA